MPLLHPWASHYKHLSAIRSSVPNNPNESILQLNHQINQHHMRTSLVLSPPLQSSTPSSLYAKHHNHTHAHTRVRSNTMYQQSNTLTQHQHDISHTIPASTLPPTPVSTDRYSHTLSTSIQEPSFIESNVDMNTDESHTSTIQNDDICTCPVSQASNTTTITTTHTIDNAINNKSLEQLISLLMLLKSDLSTIQSQIPSHILQLLSNVCTSISNDSAIVDLINFYAIPPPPPLAPSSPSVIKYITPPPSLPPSAPSTPLKSSPSKHQPPTTPSNSQSLTPHIPHTPSKHTATPSKYTSISAGSSPSKHRHLFSISKRTPLTPTSSTNKRSSLYRSSHSSHCSHCSHCSHTSSSRSSIQTISKHCKRKSKHIFHLLHSPSSRSTVPISLASSRRTGTVASTVSGTSTGTPIIPTRVRVRDLVSNLTSLSRHMYTPEAQAQLNKQPRK